MRRLFSALQGSHSIELVGADLAEFLTLCQKSGLRLWNISYVEPCVIRFFVRPWEYRRMLSLAKRCGCEERLHRTHGLPFLLCRMRHRYALLLGTALCLAALLFGSQYIVHIDVVGNAQISELEILSQLRQHGVYPGTYAPSIDQRALANDMILSLPELSFFSLNFYGTRAEAVVRERVQSPPPEVERGGSIIVADGSGLITYMEVEKGAALLTEGQMVLEGETIITGYQEFWGGLEEDQFIGRLWAPVEGRVYARTWEDLSAKIPLTATGKVYTGESHSHFSVTFLGETVKFYRNASIPYPFYDKISSAKTLRLGESLPLPFGYQLDRYERYEPSEVAIDEVAAQDMLKTTLMEALTVLVGEEGEIRSTAFVTRVYDGFLEVQLLAECTRQIGVEQELSMEEMLALTPPLPAKQEETAD